MEELEFDAAKFSRQVREHYYWLKTLEDGRKLHTEDMEKPFRESLWGCLFIPIGRLVGPYGKKILSDQYEEAGFLRFEDKAADIIDDSEIRIALCRAMRRLPKTQIVTEDVFLATLTDTLVAHRTDIPREPVLYALVGNRIFFSGLVSFCKNVGDD
jgi:hypothetical protein